MPKKKKTKITLEFSKRQLKKLFEMVMLYEVLEEILSEEPSEKVSKICEMIQPYFSDKEVENILHEAYQRLDEYVEWEDMQEFDELIEKEKDVVMNVLKEVDKLGITLGADDIFQRVNQKLGQEGLARVLIDKKQYND